MIPKFRAWYDGKMWKVGVLEWVNSKIWLAWLEADKHGNIIVDSELDIKNLILMQSTGLKDKAGSEIFEGDILSFDKSKMPAVVERVHGDLNMKVMTPKGLRWYRMFNNYDPIPERLHYHAVIGNIHQHPELLK